MHAFFSFSFFLLLFLGLRGKTKAGERCRNKCKVGEKEGRNRATNKKRERRRKGKSWECVIPLIRNCDSDLFSLISHLRLCTSLLSLSPPNSAFPLSYPPLAISHSFPLSYPPVSHQHKNFSCSVWCGACQACFEYTCTPADTSVTPRE